MYTGTWAHDLGQANLLAGVEGVTVNVEQLDSHRVAAFLDSERRLLPLVHTALAAQMRYDAGYPPPPSQAGYRRPVRIANVL